MQYNDEIVEDRLATCAGPQPRISIDTWLILVLHPCPSHLRRIDSNSRFCRIIPRYSYGDVQSNIS